MLERKLLLGSTVLAGVVAIAAAAPSVSWAQGAAKPATTTTSSTADDETEVEALVVTGSRIKRTEFTSTAPIQVVTTESAEMRGVVDTGELLQGNPLAMTGSQFNNQLTGFLTDGGPGSSLISLRGLGATRTLVLLNGRRVAPSGARGNVGPVDLNVIPQAMVERVEILKDGASSIYGSDAVAGVVNIITKSNSDGFDASAYGTANEEGGGEQYRLSLAWGKTFDRGYFNVGAAYYEQKILRRGDREDTACAADYLINPATGGRIDYTDTYTGKKYKCFNTNVNYLSTGAGSLMYPDPGITYPDAAHGNNAPAASGLVRMARAGYPDTFPYAHYDDPAIQAASVLSPVKRYTVFASGGYDLTDNIELYGQFLWNRRESEQYGSRQFFPGINLANPGNSFGATLGAITLVAPLAYDRHQEVDYVLVTGGARGSFSSFLEGWDWDIYAQYGKSEAEYGGLNAYNDRVLAVTGATACNNALITISGGSCSQFNASPIPWTSKRIVAGQFNDAEKAYLFFDETGKTTYEQTVLEGSITGDLFTLPAGPVGGAVGFQLRKEEIDDTPGPNEQANNYWGFSAAKPTRGKDNIKEVFAEIEVPIFKGLPGIESLTAQLSGRYTDYDSYGDGSTYKVGLNWQIVPSLRIRGTKGTSFRAPALYELFLGNQTGFQSQGAIDPCVNWVNSTNQNIRNNCQAAGVPDDYNGVSYTVGGVPLSTSSALITTGGGAGVLEAETSDAQTIGVIWTPSFIDLSVAVDYFEIVVNDEVRQFGAANIAYQCYSSSSFPTDPFCGLLTGGAAPGAPGRNNSGAGTVPWQIRGVNDSYVNVAEQVNRGIDLTIRYQHEFDFGSLTLDGQFTWQLEDQVEVLGGVVEDCNGQTFGGPACSTLDQGGPDFAGQMSARFDRGDWTVFWGVDLIGKGSDTEYYEGDTFGYTRYGCASAAAGCGPVITSRPVYYKQYTEFTAYHDVSVRYKKDDWTLSSGISNVFDERPPAQSNGQFRIGTAALNAYDMIGRRLFVSVTKKW